MDTDFDAKTATVVMQPGKTLTSEQVTRAFAGSKYALVGALEPLSSAADPSR